MRESNGSDDRGNMERMGESAGAMAGRAADFGMEVSGALFRSAAEMLGGWWSSDAPTQAASSWSDRAEGTCRSHYQASAGGSSSSASSTPDATAGAGIEGSVEAKSPRGAMQTAGKMVTSPDGTGAYEVEGSLSMDSATDGFAHARPGYQLGYVARQNPAYKGRAFRDIEPELQRVWESRARSEGGSTGSSSSWPDVRGFVDFAYQQGE